ncbi:MAG: COX15/CtaA family protein [Myxococcales bacterium]|nr:COX15/CtaA family protein [Myxococcales bacterium]
MDRSVQRWLWLMWALVLAMVAVGGITRLTGSGLSMVEWHPLMGALPPVGEEAWTEVFEKYKRSPQYQQVNHWMTLADFKRIFFWEYSHRLLGRLVGVAFMLPWFYFLARRRLQGSLRWRTALALLLGGLQGLLGWYMVRSGLVDVPHVSHFRLAAHLLLAFGVGQWLLWLALDAATPSHAEAARAGSRLSTRLSIMGLVALLLLQTLYGAFMAGTRAGYSYGTFPDMNGHFAPGPFFRSPDLITDLLQNPASIHYLHRALGWLVLFYGLSLWGWILRSEARTAVRRAAAAMAALCFVQLNLGAITVVSRVAIPWAVVHQVTAYLLLSATVALLHRSLARVPS